MDDQLTFELSNPDPAQDKPGLELDKEGEEGASPSMQQGGSNDGGGLDQETNNADTEPPADLGQTPLASSTLQHEPKPHVVQIAMQMKIKELELRYRNLLFFSLAALLVFLLIVMYSLKTYHESLTDIEQNYDEISQLLTSAYRGDPVAHKEVMARFPIITQSRLPRTLRSPQQSSFKPPENKNQPEALTLSNLDPSVPSAIIPVEASSSLLDDSAKLTLYSDKNEDSIELGSVSDDSEIISVTTVNIGDTLQLISDQGSWLQVYSPADYQAWVKTAELQELIE